jgi:hypothetical protein
MNSEKDSKKTMTTASKKTAVKKTDKVKPISVTKFKDLEGKFIHVKVGDQNRPATEEDINSIQSQLVDLFERSSVDCLTFVTHHAVSVDIIEKEK